MHGQKNIKSRQRKTSLTSDSNSSRKSTQGLGYNREDPAVFINSISYLPSLNNLLLS